MKTFVRQMYTRIVSTFVLTTGLYLFSWVIVSYTDVFAQGPSEATKAAIAEGFKPVENGKPVTEEVNASLLVVSAYGMFALAFVGYLIHLGRQQARLAHELVELGSRIDAVKERES